MGNRSDSQLLTVNRLRSDKEMKIISVEQFLELKYILESFEALAFNDLNILL